MFNGPSVSSAVAAKTMEALELSQALQRVRAMRRSRRHNSGRRSGGGSSGRDERTRRRTTRTAVGTTTASGGRARSRTDRTEQLERHEDEEKDDGEMGLGAAGGKMLWQKNNVKNTAANKSIRHLVADLFRHASRCLCLLTRYKVYSAQKLCIRGGGEGA